MKTLKDLKEAAERLGYEDRDVVQQILSSAGLGGNFQPERFDEYLAALVVHAKTVEKVMAHKEDIDQANEMAPCPVCGFPVVRMESRDGFLGEARGWRCTNPKQGWTEHFYVVRTQVLRDHQQESGLVDKWKQEDKEGYI